MDDFDRPVEHGNGDEPMVKSKSTLEREALKAKIGSRYFKIDAGYDKKVYENTWYNWIIIIVAFSIYYIFNILHWWANFELGTTETDIAMYYCIAIFAVTVCVVISMIISGTISNAKKLRHEFYMEKIGEKLAEI